MPFKFYNAWKKPDYKLPSYPSLITSVTRGNNKVFQLNYKV